MHSVILFQDETSCAKTDSSLLQTHLRKVNLVPYLLNIIIGMILLCVHIYLFETHIDSNYLLCRLSLWNFEPIRGSLIRPKCPKQASLGQKIF